MTYILKFDEVRSTLLDLAGERPDFNYQTTDIYKATEGCLYVDPETRSASCIVGQVVDRVLGADALALLGDSEADDGESFGVGQRDWPEEIAFDSDATMFLLTRAQTKQDLGIAWGAAVAEALAEM